MKHQNLKLISIITVFIICLGNSYSQNNELTFKSFSFALGGFQPYSGDNGNANFYASIDGTYAYKKNLFSASLNRGFDIGLYNLGKRYNLSLDILYGREIKIFKWFTLETHIGFGFFRGSYYKNDSDKWKIVKNADNSINHITPFSVSFPAKFKMLFYSDKKTAFGINISTNVNTVSNYVAYCVIYQKNIL